MLGKIKLLFLSAIMFMSIFTIAQASPEPLPDDVRTIIYNYLPPQSLNSLRHVNKYNRGSVDKAYQGYANALTAQMSGEVDFSISGMKWLSRRLGSRSAEIFKAAFNNKLSNHGVLFVPATVSLRSKLPEKTDLNKVFEAVPASEVFQMLFNCQMPENDENALGHIHAVMPAIYVADKEMNPSDFKTRVFSDCAALGNKQHFYSFGTSRKLPERFNERSPYRCQSVSTITW